MRCDNCNSELIDNDEVCKSCGSKINKKKQLLDNYFEKKINKIDINKFSWSSFFDKIFHTALKKSIYITLIFLSISIFVLLIQFILTFSPFTLFIILILIAALILIYKSFKGNNNYKQHDKNLEKAHNKLGRYLLIIFIGLTVCFIGFKFFNFYFNLKNTQNDLKSVNQKPEVNIEEDYDYTDMFNDNYYQEI